MSFAKAFKKNKKFESFPVAFRILTTAHSGLLSFNVCPLLVEIAPGDLRALLYRPVLPL